MSAPLARPDGPVLEGKYALLRELGVGGTGTVYEAEHVAMGKRVAIKVLHPALANDAASHARFEEEARAAARITHANVVGIHDLGFTQAGVPYIVMELLEGETLAELSRARGPVPAREACALMLQVLDGLSAAHRQGVVHCDLKPANVIVTYPSPDRPLVKVLDFGVARSLTELTPEQQPVSVLGTPMFMAPEQVCGQAVDERTDVYAASAVLYVLLSAQDPFSGRTSREVMEQVARGAFRPLLEANPNIPPELATLVEAGLSRKRRERTGSVEELADQLRTFLDPRAFGAARPALRTIAKAYPRPAGAALDLKVGSALPTTSEIPDSRVIRVDLAPRLVTDSLLMSPRLPKPPASPRLQLGRDFLPLPGSPEPPADESSGHVATLRFSRARVGARPAVLAVIGGFGVGVLMAWVAGLI